MARVEQMTDWDKLKQLLVAEERELQGRLIDEGECLEHLRSRVKGQDAVLADVVRLIRLQMAKENRSRPLCNLMFLGPTGTGKTELAKAIAEFLYGDSKAMIRFDCSELMNESAKTRLIGSPLGYVGSEMGGQLTRPVAANPKRVILFDEIEKAYAGVFDLFLQLMGEGRLTEQGDGKTVDFSQTIIILTSNAHAEQIGKIQAETPDYHEMLNGVKGFLADTHVFRPEILGRIDRVYVFKPLEGLVVAEIALMKIAKLGSEFKLDLEFVAPELILRALAANRKITRFGIRELERILFDMLAPQFAEAKKTGLSRVRVGVDPATGEIRIAGPVTDVVAPAA